ncbi:pentapeptide repeat-containing protein [Saccharomonospora xinjiangensis]|uniref:Putative low-complexity protein n=1 Tax=Saccharomonospora xinjiangensis XJ-54 TaxID=882086 RepID=I0V5U5_9PSEU|nr:pentapeptide repeat-containing protein [Saccharomonospora xinjiangensis]EID55498.1 putative low-complexity protein [Saccharomonospora xinjiangensis XJ-54]
MEPVAAPEDLRADCSRCAGLCCVALPFQKSAGFPADKDAGDACHHLDVSFRCRVHAELRPKGFTGCTVFDCFGAGQRVTQAFGGRNWRDEPRLAQPMFAAFTVARHLHEILGYLAEALELPAPRLRERVRREFHRIDALAGAEPEKLAATDIAAQRQQVGPLLAEVSQAVRARAGNGRDHRGADLAGRRLRGAALRGSTLRGALLIGADLRRADLRDADFLGADLRDTDLRGADLSGCFFLTQAQLNAAVGDASTRLPERLARPAHW